MAAHDNQVATSTETSIENRLGTAPGDQTILWTVYDPKVRIVADRLNVHYAHALALWHSLLDYALNNPYDRGCIKGFSVPVAAYVLELPIKEIDRVLRGFLEQMMIESDSGKIPAVLSDIGTAQQASLWKPDDPRIHVVAYNVGTLRAHVLAVWHCLLDHAFRNDATYHIPYVNTRVAAAILDLSQEEFNSIRAELMKSGFDNPHTPVKSPGIRAQNYVESVEAGRRYLRRKRQEAR